jgi:hypothetical protein
MLWQEYGPSLPASPCELRRTGALRALIGETIQPGSGGYASPGAVEAMVGRQETDGDGQILAEKLA